MSDQLPYEILIHIAMIDHGKAYREMLAIPAVGRYALKNRKQMYRQMTKKHIEYDQFNITACTTYSLFGKLHREDGPAKIYNFGRISYIQYGKYHREDGPAAIWPDGQTCYYLWNKRYNFEEWKRKVDKIKEINNLISENKKLKSDVICLSHRLAKLEELLNLKKD